MKLKKQPLINHPLKTNDKMKKLIDTVKWNIEIDIFMGNCTKDELTDGCIYAEDLDYHKNWNSLMPVVEKIRKLHTDKKIRRSDFPEP